MTQHRRCGPSPRDARQGPAVGLAGAQAGRLRDGAHSRLAPVILLPGHASAQLSPRPYLLGEQGGPSATRSTAFSSRRSRPAASASAERGWYCSRLDQHSSYLPTGTCWPRAPQPSASRAFRREAPRTAVRNGRPSGSTRQAGGHGNWSGIHSLLLFCCILGCRLYLKRFCDL